MIKFKYFNNPLKYAAFSKQPCQYCGNTENALEGVYFERSSNLKSICFNCLIQGKELVNIPVYIEERLESSIRLNNNLNEQKIKELKNTYVDELSKTPPVPWIQYNDWPVCCGDFAEYIGEWNKKMIIANSPYDDVKRFLYEILDEFSKSKIEEYNVFWNDIGINTAIFVFKCLKCNKFIAIAQSY